MSEITREMLEAAGCKIVEFPPIPGFCRSWYARDVAGSGVAHNIGSGWRMNAGCRPRFRVKAIRGVMDDGNHD